MLWLALYFPELPLTAALGGQGTQAALGKQPIAVSDGPEARPYLRSVNAHAYACGIRVGMSVAQARALSDRLVVLPRQIAREWQLLERAALRGLRFTPQCAIESDLERHCIVLDVTASVMLFGGVHHIMQALRETFANGAERFGAVSIGQASTPLAAELFARRAASGEPACQLHEMPLALVPWLSASLQTLLSLGLRTLGEVASLPRDGLARRFGKETLVQLDRCLGRTPDPRTPYIPPEQWRTQLQCLTPIHEGPNLLHGIEQGLEAMADWLMARASGTRAFTVRLLHSQQRQTDYVVSLSELSCDPKRWRSLLIEHFQRRPVQEAVHAIVLECVSPEPLLAVNHDLFTSSAFTAPSWLALVDRLLARLGAQAVYQLRLQADHRPERAQRLAGAQEAPVLVGKKGDAKVQLAKNGAEAEGAIALSAQANPLTPHPSPASPPAAIAHPLRPLFLLPHPRALLTRDGLPSYHGALVLLTPPERIQTGWWDDKPVARDYFIARNAQGTLCWIFQSLSEPQRWFLHGFFA